MPSATTSTWRLSALALVPLALVAGFGAMSALLVHVACTNPGPPVARPDPGTARAGYCGAVHGGALWLLLVVVPVLVTGVAAVLARGRPRWWRFAVAALAIAAPLANVFIVHSLDFAHTI
jgi:hypothetical protein